MTADTAAAAVHMGTLHKNAARSPLANRVSHLKFDRAAPHGGDGHERRHSINRAA